MEKQKTRNAIFIADNRPFLLGHLLLQIQDTNPDLFDEALVYHQNMSKKDMGTLEKIMPCRFVNYDTDKLPDELFESNYNFKRFTKFMFARYEMFNYLDEFDNILWIDTDMMIQGDLTELIDMAKETGYAMLREDKENKSAKNTDTNRTNFTKEIHGYNMNEYLYCSGIIVINKCLKDYDQITDYLYQKTVQYANYLSLPDQGVLNLMIEDFKIDVKPIGQKGKYGAYPYVGRDCSESIVIHSWGKNKFWNSWYLYNLFPKWKVYYDKWIELGGSKYNGTFLPDISVIIPVYKPKIDFFKNQMNTVLNQMYNSYENYTNFEIIIVAEPVEVEELEETIKEYNDPRIKLIINNERKGIAGSINIGMKEAKGKYIARIDDDDYCHSHRLIKQFEYLETNSNVTLCTSNYEYFGDMNEGRITLEGEYSKAWSIFTCPFDHPTIMFNREFFIKNNLFYDETRSHVEDWELWLRAFDAGMTVGSIPETLYYHRWYNGQAGQNNKTITMMRELVKKNFAKLNIDLSEADLDIVAPWQGKIDDSRLPELEEIYTKALENNKKLNLYDQKALETVFSYRVSEAKTGRLEKLIYQINHDKEQSNNKSLKRKIKDKVLGPVYRPFKRVMYNISAESVRDNVYHIENKIDCFTENIKNQIENVIKDTTIEQNKKMEIIKNDFSKKIINEINELKENHKREIETLKNEIVTVHDQFYDYEKEYTLYKNINHTNLFFEKKLILFGTSEHGNIGDAAITSGTYEFIRKYFNDYKVIEVSTYEFIDNFKYLKNIINKDDLLFLQGGGNLGNMYICEEEVRREVIKNFPNNKIVILPQTIHFDETDEGQEELEKSKKIYNAHNNLTIFTRGKESLEKAKEYFVNAKCYSMIDMALNNNYNYNFERAGILACIRDKNDEGGFSENEMSEIFNIVKDFDNSYTQTTNKIEGNINKNVRNSFVYEQLQQFAKHKLVVTDRLHGLVFCLMTNTPCIALSSFNHKIKDFVNLLGTNDNIVFIDKNINQLKASIENIMDKNSNIINNYDKEFEKMAKIIKED